ncbi:MAG: hypothetical protein SGBAC_011248 [Bacillariaceae sp.]
MSDSESSDDEGIPSISALLHSLVPDAPDSDDDSDDDSDSPAAGVGGANAAGKLPPSISNLVHNLIQQYDSISDDSDSGNSSSDDDEAKGKKTGPAHVPSVPVNDSDDDEGDKDADVDLSNLVQNILKSRAHRDSVEINSRLGPVTVNVPKSSPRASPKKIDHKKSPATSKQVSPSTNTISTASTMEGTHHLLSSRHSIGLQDTMHSLPEDEAITSPMPLSNPVRNNKSTPLSTRKRRSNRKSNHFEANTIQQTSRSSSLNEDSHTVISAASTNSGFDPAELEDAFDDDNTEASSSIQHGSFSSKRSRTKKVKKSPKRSKSSSSTSQSAASSKGNSKRSKSNRRKFDKQPLSPLLGKMVGDSSGGEKDDILSPLETPMKKKTKTKSSKTMKSESEQRDSRSKRSRSSLSHSSRKSSKEKNETKKGKGSLDRSTSRRSKEKAIPETPAPKKERSSRSQRTVKSIGRLSPPLIKQRAQKRSVRPTILSGSGSDSLPNSNAVIPETPVSISQHSSIRSDKKDSLSRVSPSNTKPKRRRGQPIPATPSTRQSKTLDMKETHTDHQHDSIANSHVVDTLGQDKALSPGEESGKLFARRITEEEVEYEVPLQTPRPIQMISFSTHKGGLLPLDDTDTSISSSSTEEEDEYETESSEGEGGTEYGTVVSGSQISQSMNHDSMHLQSVAPSSEGDEYESEYGDASNVVNKDVNDDYEEYESDKSPSARVFDNDNAAIDDEYESDESESFVEPPMEAPKRTGRRTMLQRAEKQSDLSLDGLDDEYESDSEEDPIEEPPKRDGRRAMLERSVSSADLTAVLDEYELDSDTDGGDDEDNSDSFVEEEAVVDAPKRTGRRTMLQRAEKQSDLSRDGLDDEYESDSEEDPIEEPPKRDGRRAMLERSVSSADLTAVLDEYELDSDTDGGNNEDYEGSRDGSDDESSEDGYKTEPQGKSARERESWPASPGKNQRESWPAPGNNPRRPVPLSDASSSVDYTDDTDSIELDNMDYAASSDDESQEPTNRSNRQDFENENKDGSEFDSDGEFDFEDDYNVIGVASDESSDESDAYSAASGSHSVEDRNYYEKLNAVTRREDQLALRSQRLKRKVYFAVGTIFVMIVGLIVLFIVNPLEKDVLSEGGRRLRGTPKTH